MIAPADLLHLAQSLAQGPGEVEWRTAVGRAYYATFHTGRDLLSDLGFAVPRAAAHSYVWMRLMNCGATLIEQAGVQLNCLYSERAVSEYELHRHVHQSKAGDAVRIAKQVMADLATALVEPTRSQVRDGVRVYERNTLQQVTYQGP